MLRYRNLLVAQTARIKNKIAGLLLETGTEYNRQHLHGQRYFQELLTRLEHVPDSVLFRIGRRVIFPVSEVEAWLERYRSHGPPELGRLVEDIFAKVAKD